MKKIKNKKEVTTNSLLAVRQKLGYSQTEVADRMDTTVQSLDRWEKGKGMPSLPHLLSLSVIYQTLPELLYADLYAKAKKELAKVKSKKR